MKRKKETEPEAERARRLEETIRRGPRPPRTPHEFIQEKMRDEQRKKDQKESK